MEKLVKHNIQQLRKLRGLSQEEVADHMGISQSAYNRLEYGNVSVKVSHLTILAELYQIEIQQFFENNGFSIVDGESSTVSEPASSYKSKSHKMMVEVELSDEEYQKILPVLKKNL
jgi:transcriptional regulator with XRE-family HTH domain